MTILSETLNNELEQRGWSMRELGRRADVSNSLISDVVNDKITASADFCIKIAQALQQPAEDWLRLGGYLPQLPPSTSDEREAISLWRRLDNQIRNGILTTMRSLLGIKTLEPETMSETRPPYAAEGHSLREHLIEQITRDLVSMPPEDAQRVVDLMEKLRDKDRSEAGSLPAESRG